ncbi:MAG: cell wall hydrolase [Candidatus Thiodiazotropha sp. 6PLUC9]
MNCKKTNRKHIAFMAKLIFFTLYTLSNGIYAQSAEDDKAVDLFEEDHTNLWQWLSLDATNQTLKLTNELQCLALNIYFEARSESVKGQHAVGHVVMNRVAHRGFPNTICDVVKQGGEVRRNRCQFSWWCDGRSDEPANRKAWLKSLDLAYDIYLGRVSDPTRGALWYHADYVSPKWSKALTMVTKIGQHIFYQSRKQPTYAMNLSTTLHSAADKNKKL